MRSRWPDLRKTLGAALLAFLSPTLFGSLLMAQGLSDLVGRSKEEAKGLPASDRELRFGRDRVDLGLSPGLGPISPAERKSVGLSAQADLRMICGQYDLKASLQHLLGREAREEFLAGILNSLVQEVIGSGMELLCQAEPTLCTLIQNYSVSANLKMSYYKDLCTAIESAVVDAQKKNYANAVDECLKEKKDQGVPLDRAMDLCQKKNVPIRGFQGEVLGELDLGKALHGLFENMGLSPGAQELVRRISDETRVGPSSAAVQADPNGVSRLYDELREDSSKTLSALIEQARNRQPIATLDLEKAVPPGAPPLAEDEIRAFALLPDWERAAVVSSLSSALALFRMGGEIREVERAIEVLLGAPTVDEAKRKMLEDRLVRLRSERGRLMEYYREHALVLEAIAASKAVAGREFAQRVAGIQAKAGLERWRSEMLNDVARIGALPVPGAAGRQGVPAKAANCAGCGLESSFGSYGDGK